jgi:hypothetical protein
MPTGHGSMEGTNIRNLHIISLIYFLSTLGRSNGNYEEAERSRRKGEFGEK